MTSLQSFLLACMVAHGILRLTLATSDAAYPPPYGLDQSSATTTTTCNCATKELIHAHLEVHGGGRIIDISHRYHSDMPAWESSDGIGNFMWLSMSMKNGSAANMSKMKLSVHTGTHVDAPGHVFDHYFDAGFDVDSLDLDVLNGLA